VNAKEAEARIAALEQALQPKADLADQIAALTRTVDQTAAAIAERQHQITTLDADVSKLEKLARYHAPLEASTARIAELTAVRAQVARDAATATGDAQRRHDDRVAEIDTQTWMVSETLRQCEGDLEVAQAALTDTAAANSQAAVLQRDLAQCRTDWDAVTTTLAVVASGRQELERRRQEIAAKQTRLTDLRGRLARIEQELLEWRDLAKALGKGGLPDLEIDAAGPTISALTNELLLACFGARFSLELVTQVAKADGGGMKDLFTVAVTDNEAGGQVRDIGMLSGGEKVVVQEALMCAIAVFVNQRSPLPIRTLWRDETGAALDHENAVRYVAMLRKVRALGGFHHVFFISHNPAAAALADVQIHVGGGTARIVHPPFSEAA
jgi:exonuclease SbcC